jgi:D-sedoheptulose 7-phosphate isomerase
MHPAKSYSDLLDEHNAVFGGLHQIMAQVTEAAAVIVETLRSGGKLLICGNGGSAADAQHFAAELMGRFERERRALPAIALGTDTSVLTALANDYGYERVFARQVEGLAIPGDVLIGISTSGGSKNVTLAVTSAKNMGVKSIGLLGRDGGPLASEVNIPVIVPHSVTARIQEAHNFIIHYWCFLVETTLFTPEK